MPPNFIPEGCLICIDQNVLDLTGIEDGSIIAFCSCEYQGQAAAALDHMESLDANDLKQYREAIQKFCDPLVNGPSGMGPQTNDPASGQLREKSGESSGSLSQVNRRQLRQFLQVIPRLPIVDDIFAALVGGGIPNQVEPTPVK